jgi:hypothetical protein
MPSFRSLHSDSLKSSAKSKVWTNEINPRFSAPDDGNAGADPFHGAHPWLIS